MIRESGIFAGTGGVAIHRDLWAPADRAPRAVVLVAHGYGEHLGRYAHWREHLATRGFASLAIDHRGHGRSGGQRGHSADVSEFIADLRTLADTAEARWPGVPRLFFGHSMGGLIGFHYLLRHPDTVRAGALSGPAFRLATPVGRTQRTLVAVLGRVRPTTRLPGRIDADALARDPAVGPAYLSDPLVHREVTAGLFRTIVRAQAEAEAAAARLAVPTLILQGDADRIVDPEGAAAIGARLPPPSQVVSLAGYYHELLNEPAAERARVIEALDRWFDRWLAG